jgi:hypothetical protein
MVHYQRGRVDPLTPSQLSAWLDDKAGGDLPEKRRK